MLDTPRILHWLAQLVRIPSVNLHQAGVRAGEAGEAAVARFVAEWFVAFGAEVYRDEVLPERPSIYGMWRGESDRWLALDVHTDTAGVEQMLGDPFDGRVEHGRLYGRGAVDTKASLAIALAILESAAERHRQPKVNLLVAATVDEEGDARGAAALRDWLKSRELVVDQMLVAEPTECAPVHGHKGCLRLTFTVRGRACHSSQPEMGANAVTAAARIALAMEQEHREFERTSSTSALGLPSLTVTSMHGGRGMSVVPDTCALSVDRRVVTGEHLPQVANHLEDVARMASPLPLDMVPVHMIEPFYQPPDSELVRTLAQLCDASPRLAPYCTNAWAYGDVARQCAVIGPGSINEAHADVEWVEVAQLEKLAAAYARMWGLE